MYDIIYTFLSEVLIKNADVEQIELAQALTKLTIILVYIALISAVVITFKFFRSLIKGDRFE